MTSKYSIRPDVHARFVALVARVDARVTDERRVLQRRLAPSPAGGSRAADGADGDDDR
jgi:hypothetical protein